MKIKEKIKLDDLYFGVVLMPLSYSSKEQRTALKTYNLFDFSRVKFSVARWVTMTKEEKKNIVDPLRFMFGDVWSRAEYEFIVCPWPYGDGDGEANNGQKVDTYRMYVEPNRELLLDLANRVTKSSARAYIREWRKRYKK